LNVAVEVWEPLIDVGANWTVTPEGRFEADSATDEENPSIAAIEIVESPLPPCTTVSDDGLAPIVKSGVCVWVPARALTSEGVGLPHPVTRS
jgi:hypothetical protein